MISLLIVVLVLFILNAMFWTQAEKLVIFVVAVIAALFFFAESAG